MALKLTNIASGVAKFGVTAQQALSILSSIITLIGMAENFADDIKGNQKLQLVLSGLDAVFAELNVTDEVATLKAKLSPVISMIVGYFNLLKLWDSYFPKPTDPKAPAV